MMANLRHETIMNYVHTKGSEADRMTRINPEEQEKEQDGKDVRKGGRPRRQ